MVDGDSVEVCQNKGSWQPIALIENVYDTGNYKKYTNVIKSLGKSAYLPVFLGFYKKTTQYRLTVKVQRLSTTNGPLNAMSEEEWVSVLRDLQDQHKKVCKHDQDEGFSSLNLYIVSSFGQIRRKKGDLFMCLSWFA